MEIRIKAVKQKLAYEKTDSTLGLIMKENKERFFPLFELMLKEINDNQIKNIEGEKNYE